MSKQTEQQTEKISNTVLSAAIFLSLEVKSTFEMYSYRIITPEVFKSRLEELYAQYNETINPKLD